MNRRARKTGAEGRVTDDDLDALIASSGQRCHWCGITLDFRKGRGHKGFGANAGDATFDHLIDLSAGGRGSIDNLVAACHACNTLRSRVSDGHSRERVTAYARQLRRYHAIDAILDPAVQP